MSSIVPYSARGEIRPGSEDLNVSWCFSVALCPTAGDTSAMFGAVWCSPTAVIDDVLGSEVLHAITVEIAAVVWRRR